MLRSQDLTIFVPIQTNRLPSKYVRRTLIVFLTNDTALRMLEYNKPDVTKIIGNSQCLFKFKDVVRLVYTHYR